MAETRYSFNRLEKKYQLTEAQYERLLPLIREYLVPDPYPRYSLGNLYYDTEDQLLFRRSAEQPMYKEKLRLRAYGIPGPGDPVFLEIKKKYDGIVYKRRIRLTNEAAMHFPEEGSQAADSQIRRELAWFFERYRPQPKVFLAYEREAFSGRSDPTLRITFDRNIRFRLTELDLGCGDHGTRILPEDSILMEIKTNGNLPLWLVRFFSGERLFPRSFSKIGYIYKKNLLAQAGERK